MNAKSIILYTVLCFSITVFVSCQSHEQKADEAFERVKEEKKDSNDTDVIINEAIEEPAKPEIINRIVNLDDWSKFKADIDKKILVSEDKIKAIEATPGANASLVKELTSLQKEYNDLKRKMAEYNEDVKQELGKFKVKMDHEVNEIDIEVNDKINSNKK